MYVYKNSYGFCGVLSQNVLFGCHKFGGWFLENGFEDGGEGDDDEEELHVELELVLGDFGADAQADPGAQEDEGAEDEGFDEGGDDWGAEHDGHEDQLEGDED